MISPDSRFHLTIERRMASPRSACHWYVTVIRDTAGQRNLPRVVVSDKVSRSSVASVEAFVVTNDAGNYKSR